MSRDFSAITPMLKLVLKENPPQNILTLKTISDIPHICGSILLSYDVDNLTNSQYDIASRYF